MNRKTAHNELTKWINNISHEDVRPMVDDCTLVACRGCGKKAWLREDIKHARNCEVAKALRCLSLLADGA